MSLKSVCRKLLVGLLDNEMQDLKVLYEKGLSVFSEPKSFNCHFGLKGKQDWIKINP